MKNFRKVLKEVNLIVDGVMAFDIILTSALIFLICYLGLMLVKLNPWYGLFPTLAYLIFLLYIDINTNKFKLVENKYAPLYEKLRTSADNINLENEVVDELQKEVISDLGNVRVSSFVKLRKISSKVLSSIVLCLIILFASIYNVNFADFNVTFEEIKDLIYRESSGEGGDSAGDELVAGNAGGGEDIYGAESTAKLGTKEIQIKIRQSSMEVTGTMLEEIPEREFEETFPDEIFSTSSAGYEELIEIENQQLVKNYFKELSKG